MATPIMIGGDPGTGKTVSLRNLDPKTTFIIGSDKKPLNLPQSKVNYKTVLKENGKLDLQKSNYYETAKPGIVKAMLHQISENAPHIKVVVIDTITNIMTAEYIPRINEKGYNKFNDLALDTYELISMLRDLREDLTVVVITHLQHQYDAEGVLKSSFKVPGGKLISSGIEPESFFHMVLYTEVSMVAGKPTYHFLTQNNGKNTCRTPFGLFEEVKIPNDLAYVLSEYEKIKQ